MTTGTHEAETQDLRAAKRYVLEVKLDDGDVIRANAGSDPERARAQLAAIHATGATDTFVYLGDDTVVRSRDVRYVRLREAGHGDDGPGLMDSLKQRVGGGSLMATYDTEQGARSTRVRMGGESGGGESRGFFDRQEIGYGRRPWSETKPFFLTSEFLTLAGIIAAIAIAMAVLDNFNANRGWLLITIIGAAYMIARGLAKSGTRDPNPRDYR